jgi:hypothetical protein
VTPSAASAACPAQAIYAHLESQDDAMSPAAQPMHPTLSTYEATGMPLPIGYSIREQSAGLWRVCCGDNVLHEVRKIGTAIKLAHLAAIDGSPRTGP